MQSPEIIFFTILYTLSLIFVTTSVAVGNFLSSESGDQTKINKFNKKARIMVSIVLIILVLIIIFQYNEVEVKKYTIHKWLGCLLICYFSIIIIYIGVIKKSPQSAMLSFKSSKNSELEPKLKLNPSFFLLVGALIVLVIVIILELLLYCYDENIDGFLND
jgi:hypothetical protein